MPWTLVAILVWMAAVSVVGIVFHAWLAGV